MKRFVRLSALFLLLLAPARSFADPVCCSTQISQILADTKLSVPDFCRDTVAEIGCYKGFPVNVEYIAGVVCHIGVNIFGIGGKDILPGRLSRFVERYSLMLLSMPESDKMLQMTHDGVVVEGNLLAMPNGGIEGYDVSSQLVDGNTYNITFGKNGKSVLSFSFPAECELIFGMDKKELESFFCFHISTHKYSGASIMREKPEPIRLTNDIFFDKIDTYMIEDMLQGLYLIRSRKELVPLNDMKYPMYTIQNILSEPSVADGIMTEVAVFRYGFKKDYYTVPLQSVIDMCLSDGCRPYVGFSEVNPGQSAVAVLIMSNSEEGYNHIFEFSFNKDFFDGKSNIVSAEVNSFVPTHNLTNLYDDNNQKRHVDDIRKIIVK